jgi:hypothetical protein
MGISQGRRSITLLRTNQVVKGRRVRNTRSKVLQIPEISKGLENRGGTVRGRLASGRVNTVVLNVSLGRVRRDKPGRHTAAQTVKVKGVGAAIGGGLGVGLVVWADGQRGLDVVVETAGLVEGDEQEGLVPLGTGADGIVDLLDEDLAERDVARGVHGVGVEVAAGGVDVGELGQEAEVGVLVEVLKGDDVLLRVLDGPVEEESIGKEGTVGAVVVLPGDVLLAGSLENAGDVDARDVETVVVVAVAISGTGEGAQAVGVGGLFSSVSLYS